MLNEDMENASNFNYQNESHESKVKILMKTLNEKDESLQKAEMEIKHLRTTKEEIIKILREKDENLALALMEEITEKEILIREELLKSTKNEKSLTKCWVPDQKTEKLQIIDKGKMIGKFLPGENIEKFYNEYERELLAFYSGKEEDVANYNHEQESFVKIEELQDIDWQYVLVFPNPDYEDKPQYENDKIALTLLDKYFVPDKRKPEQKASYQENLVFKNILQKTVEKEMQKNGTQVYKVNKGGSLEKDPTTQKWSFKSSQAKDLHTVIRNIALYKLSKVLHFKTFSLLSEKGDYIYVLINANEDLLKNEADWMEFPLQFEIGNTDLISLEPCDEKYIPLRCVTLGKPDFIVKLEEETQNFMKFLYEDEWENFLTMKSTIPAVISSKDWEAYKIFLEELIKYKNKVINLSSLYPDLKGVLGRELYESAYEEVQITLKYKLKNVWDYYQSTPSGPYKSYFREYDKSSGIDKANLFWKRYITGKKNEISLFNGVDKIKIILSLMSSQLRLEKMLNDGYLSSYFPLHSWDYNNEEKDKKIIPDIENQNLFDYNSNKISNVVNIEENEGKIKNNNSLAPIVSEDKIKEHITKKLAADEETYTTLEKNWKFSLLGKMPAKKIKRYFGEKIGFYFEFLSFYTISLFFLGIIGIITYIIQYTDSLQSKSIEFFSELGFKKSTLIIVFNTFYSFAVILWSTIFLEIWKRKEAKLATQWGHKFSDYVERPLPSFTGRTRRSPVNDSLKELYYPLSLHFLKKLIGYLVSLIIVAIVILIVVYLLYFRNWLVDNRIGGNKLNRFIVNVPTAINAIQIIIFDFIYRKIAILFNNFENYKTFESYESSYTTKIFLFQFANSFNSLFIIAFIKRSINFFGGCVKTFQFTKETSVLNYCEEELENQMVTIAIINFFKNFLEIGLPWLKNFIKTKLRNKNQNKNLKIDESVKEYNPIKTVTKIIDKQNNLNDFNIGYIDETCNDYMELVVQFGFVTMFAISFPLIPIIFWATNLFEIQVDKSKLIYFFKRPNPISASGIDYWYYLFELISFIGIFTNVAVLVYTSNSYFELNNYEKTLLYMALVFFYITIKLIITRLIPDYSQKVHELQKRQIYVIEKNCDGLSINEQPKKYERLNLKVHIA